MKCYQCRKFLPLYVGNELSDSQAELFQKHIGECSQCKSLFDEYVSLQKLVREISVPKIPAKYCEELKKSVHGRIQSLRRPLHQKKSQFIMKRYPKLVWAIVLIILIIPASLFFYHYFQDRSYNLETYLLDSDVIGLSQALHNAKARDSILNDHVSIQLLIDFSENLEKHQKRYGIVNPYLNSILTKIQQDPKYRSINLDKHVQINDLAMHLRKLNYSRKVSLSELILQYSKNMS